MLKVYEKPPPTNFKVGEKVQMSFISKNNFRLVLFFGLHSFEQSSAQVEQNPYFSPYSINQIRNAKNLNRYHQHYTKSRIWPVISCFQAESLSVHKMQREDVGP